MREKIEKEKLYRVLDANLNRAKEGLRVCEEVVRFIFNSSVKTKAFKDIRHQLTDALEVFKLSEIILARDIENDVGKVSTASELKRRDLKDIFYANIQRVKESVRVLEEFTKLLNVKTSDKLKRLRYRIYELEKKIASEF